MAVSPKVLNNISNSVNSYFFSKCLKIGPDSKAQILEKLSVLFGLVYLENNANPIIAFLPKQFYKIDGERSATLARDEHFSYQKMNQIDTLEQFLQLDALKKQSFNDQFCGGYIGFVDYDYAAQQHINGKTKDSNQFYLGQYDSFLTLDHGQWFFHSHEMNAETIFHTIEQLLETSTQITTHQHFKVIEPCRPRWTPSEYSKAFDRIQDYILAGDCYQINLTQEFQAKAEGSLIDTIDDFWNLTNAPYSAYLKLDDFEILSCSPELFIDFQANREIITKPIKGTMPRFSDPIKDQISKQSLIDSQKDQAENVMIVDLLRNDLSLYAETGSVKTTKLFNIESFNQVHHMVSEVRATLNSEVNAFDVLMSALPGGSITGAPKIRAMQIIEELEGSPRGAYCGSMGYFNYDGTGSWNILIRTIQKYGNDVSIWAGGGITIASECQAEYQECFDKVSALLDLLNSWHQPD